MAIQTTNCDPEIRTLTKVIREAKDLKCRS
jgi:hypothetical protein